MILTRAKCAWKNIADTDSTLFNRTVKWYFFSLPVRNPYIGYWRHLDLFTRFINYYQIIEDKEVFYHFKLTMKRSK